MLVSLGLWTGDLSISGSFKFNKSGALVVLNNPDCGSILLSTLSVSHPYVIFCCLFPDIGIQLELLRQSCIMTRYSVCRTLLLGLGLIFTIGIYNVSCDHIATDGSRQ
jgi:hypothetical protein